MFGSRAWLGVFVGAFAANLVHFIELSHLSGLVMSTASLGIAFGNCLEALAVYFLCARIIGTKQPLDEVSSIFKFVPVALVSCLLASCVGTLTMLALGLEKSVDAWLVFSTWWFGDALAILIVTPLMISWWPLRSFATSRLIELGAAFAVLLLLCEIIFGGRVDLMIFGSQPSFVMPVLMWLAIRFSKRELTTGIAIICLVAVHATANHYGPFVATTLTESFLSEQLFSAMLAVTMLVLSAAVGRARQYQRSLKQANEALEHRVAARTLELEKKTRVLEAINHQLRIEAQGRLSAETQLRTLQHKDS